MLLQLDFTIFPIHESDGIHFFFYKQLGLGPSPQSCSYFQDFQGSKLLSSCLAVWPNKHFSCVFPRFLVNHIISFSDCSKKFLLNSKLLFCFSNVSQNVICNLFCNLQFYVVAYCHMIEPSKLLSNFQTEGQLLINQLLI